MLPCVSRYRHKGCNITFPVVLGRVARSNAVCAFGGIVTESKPYLIPLKPVLFFVPMYCCIGLVHVMPSPAFNRPFQLIYLITAWGSNRDEKQDLQAIYLLQIRPRLIHNHKHVTEHVCIRQFIYIIYQFGFGISFFMDASVVKITGCPYLPVKLSASKPSVNKIAFVLICFGLLALISYGQNNTG
jgi:hypothetical protein